MSKSEFQLMRGLNLHKPDERILLGILERELKVLHLTEAECEMMKIGFHIAFMSHENAPPRESGEAYIFHPWRAAIRMIRIQHRLGIKDVSVIMVIMLHDSVEDAAKAGKDPLVIRNLILRKTTSTITRDVLYLSKMNRDETDDEFYIRVLSLSEWRPITAKLIERSDNIKTIWSMPLQKQKAKIAETEKWLHILFNILNTAIEREVKSNHLPRAYLQLPHVLYSELKRALTKEKKRLKLK